jgi:cell division protease FtsH
MDEFNRVIGYDPIKNELRKLSDMFKNGKYYEALGATLPRGLILYGDPGLGKTLLADCFIKECGVRAYTVRATDGGVALADHITSVFREARENAPCIILLDDMDKYANEDVNHKDAKEYIAIQTGIDESREHEVFVIATVNNMRKLPDSLKRAGRFDKRIKIDTPFGKEAEDIVMHYLSTKKVSRSVELSDISKSMDYISCADIETIINNATVNAAHKRKSSIETEDIMTELLSREYGRPYRYEKTSTVSSMKAAVHEMGHLIVSEMVSPGSVGLISVLVTEKETKGYVHTCEVNRDEDSEILVCLAGKAAVEIVYPGEIAEGCSNDISEAIMNIRHNVLYNGSLGFALLDVNYHQAVDEYPSETIRLNTETIIRAELERYMLKAKKMLEINMDFLRNGAKELLEKGYLMYSDIQILKGKYSFTMNCF